MFSKHLFPGTLLSLMLIITGCQAAPGTASGGLAQKQDSLAKVVAKMHEEFEMLKIGLEKRGVSLDQIRAEIEAENKVWDIPVGTSPIDGNVKAPITIVEFSDLQCAYCARIAPHIQELVRKYPQQVRVIFKHFPLNFHTLAPPAHAAMMAAQNQGKFWEYRYALAPHFRNLKDSTFLAVAQQVGLKMDQFRREMVLDAAKQARINEDIALGTRIGVQGTPNFFVNGKRQDRFSPALIDKMVADLPK